MTEARARDVPVIVISGTMGSGKTTVMNEASDILSARGVPHAAIDLDALGMAQLLERAAFELAYVNLASVWQNYAAAGATRLLLAGAIESRAELDRLRRAVPGATVVVCRLQAQLDTMQQRVALRDPGMLRDQFVARVAELEIVLDRVRLEHFCVSNDDRSITAVAGEVLTRAGWI